MAKAPVMNNLLSYRRILICVYITQLIKISLLNEKFDLSLNFWQHFKNLMKLHWCLRIFYILCKTSNVVSDWSVEHIQFVINSSSFFFLQFAFIKDEGWINAIKNLKNWARSFHFLTCDKMAEEPVMGNLPHFRGVFLNLSVYSTLDWNSPFCMLNQSICRQIPGNIIKKRMELHWFHRSYFHCNTSENGSYSNTNFPGPMCALKRASPAA